MKRINPKTNQIFERGDKRESDSLVFHKYDLREKRKTKDGFFYEQWVKEDSLEKSRQANRDWFAKNPNYSSDWAKENPEKKVKYSMDWAKRNPEKHRERNNKVHQRKRERLKIEGVYRLNENGKKFARGQKEGDRYFWNYRTGYLQHCGKLYGEDWYNYEDFINKKCKSKISDVYSKAKIESYGEPNITTEYIYSLYPSDNPICPIFKIPFTLTRGNAFPELDRIDNNKGYIKGNVGWISHKANMIKYDYTLDELKLIINYLEELS